MPLWRVGQGDDGGVHGEQPGAIAANFYQGARSEYLAPYVFYSVHVQSAPGPWVFDGPRAVGWLLGYPAPLLFCIVDKRTTQSSVYPLRARFDTGA